MAKHRGPGAWSPSNTAPLVGTETPVLAAFGGKVVIPSTFGMELMSFQRGTFDIAPPPLYFSGGEVQESAETSILEPISSSTAAKRVGG